MLKLKNILAGTAVSVVLAVTAIGSSVAGFDEAVQAYEAGDYTKALQEWLLLAEARDPAAMRNVGHMYRRGLGVEQNFKKAMNWYARAAEMGFDRAQANVASMYLRGQGVPQDYVKAATWFTKAARNGHTIAQYNLGLMYEHGKGIEKSAPKALAWYNLAAKAGHKLALNKVSVLVASNPDIKDEAPFKAPAEKPALAPVSKPIPPVTPIVKKPEAVQKAPPVEQKTTVAPGNKVATTKEPIEKKFDPFASSANNAKTDKTEKSGAPTVFSKVKEVESTTPVKVTTDMPVDKKVAPKPVAEVLPLKTEEKIVAPVEKKEPVVVAVTPQKVENTPEKEKKGFFSALTSLVMGDDEEKPAEAVTTPLATTVAPVSAIQVPTPKSVETVYVVPGSGLSVPERLEMASLSFEVEEYQQALSVWASLAQEGNSEAQFHLGQMFFEGFAVPIDRVKAYHWWAKAKANGSSVAATSLDNLEKSLTFLEKRRLQRVN